ncbi:coiled-coil domain-containing protein 43 isoform X1 [Denticeps clupeoides]|uniref:coiled-coil domain-containing protein 43 isoform X1 n=1 Tax=Denticeps clupeoides TaxID=299321 RepID=UPI0010A57A6D|nr:coiled-coil domain-containing protein 43 isoform X1 [Denticeps clupeoides]
MAAPEKVAGEFENWLNQRLDALEIDKDVYGTYILGVLQEEEADEEKRDALQGILSAFLEDDHLEDVCKQIIGQWTEHCSKSATPKKAEAEVQAIASLIEKQAQMVVKQKEVTDQERERKQALLAQYANVTDEEDDGEDELNSQMSAAVVPSENSLFKNTNVEDVLSRQRQKRDQAKEDSQKKKEQDKMQREKDKLAKQERRDKEKKRTQKGERKR